MFLPFTLSIGFLRNGERSCQDFSSHQYFESEFADKNKTHVRCCCAEAMQCQIFLTGFSEQVLMTLRTVCVNSKNRHVNISRAICCKVAFSQHFGQKWSMVQKPHIMYYMLTLSPLQSVLLPQ